MSSNLPRKLPVIITASGQLASHIRLVARGLRDDDGGPPGGTHSDDGDWDTIGTFVIEFQRARDPKAPAHRSLAHHMESAETSQWLGIVTGPLLSWMLGRLVRGTDDADRGDSAD